MIVEGPSLLFTYSQLLIYNTCKLEFGFSQYKLPFLYYEINAIQCLTYSETNVSNNLGYCYSFYNFEYLKCQHFSLKALNLSALYIYIEAMKILIFLCFMNEGLASQTMSSFLLALMFNTISLFT